MSKAGVTKSGMTLDELMARKINVKELTKKEAPEAPVPPGGGGLFGWLQAWCLMPTPDASGST
eukprot:708714-Prorocentrum_minimum.AAC.1